MIHTVCECGTTGRFETTEQAIDAGWTRLSANNAERWFCPREASTTINEGVRKLATNPDDVRRESRIRE